MSPVSPEHQARIAELEGHWWHSITLPDGTVIPGYKTVEQLEEEWAALSLPALAGKEVLDIGAWDGYFSFRAEQAGASAVTALDHFVWSLDALEKLRYHQACREAGVPPRPYDEVPELWKPDELPGKRPFDLACELLDSRVRSVVVDFMSADVDALPCADVVLFLGVLYHLKDPVRAMERVRAVTRELAVIETEAVHLPTYPSIPLAEFIPGSALHDDPTNWWAPNEAGLAGLARAAGFSRVESVGPGFERARADHAAYVDWARREGPEEHRACPDEKADQVFRYRAVIHAWV